MSSINEMLGSLKWVMNCLLYDGNEDREKLLSLLQYYRAINDILLDLLGTAIGEKELDDDIKALLFNGYYTYVKSYNILLMIACGPPNLNKTVKEELLKIISEDDDSLDRGFEEIY